PPWPFSPAGLRLADLVHASVAVGRLVVLLVPLEVLLRRLALGAHRQRQVLEAVVPARQDAQRGLERLHVVGEGQHALALGAPPAGLHADVLTAAHARVGRVRWAVHVEREETRRLVGGEDAGRGLGRRRAV